MNRLMMLPLLPALALMVSGCEKDLAIAGPSEAMAQEAPVPTDGQRRAGPGMRVGSPLGSVLQQREALGLTEAQVTRLESIAERLRTERDAARAEMQARMGDVQRPGREAMGAMTPEQRAALRESMRARRETLRPLMQELVADQRAAMEEVREVLTDEQEAKLQELRAEWREGRPGMQGRRGQFRRMGRLDA